MRLITAQRPNRQKFFASFFQKRSSFPVFFLASPEARRRLFVTAATALALTTQLAAAAPATTHPRLWVTQADITNLANWTVPSNQTWQNGLLAAAMQGAATADAHWNYTTGVPDSGWKDAGSSSYEEMPTEAYAEMFAFMSMVDPVQANRPQWALRAHTLLMWAMNQAYWAVLNGDDTTDTHPFAWAGMSTYNRASSWGEAWGLTVDWIYPSLTAADKATIHGVFVNWGNDILHASTTGNEHPQPIGVLNDLQLIGGSPSQSAIQQQEAQLQFRFAANNYFLAHMRNLAVYSMSFDPADDPNGALGGLVANTIGAWLYQAYAIFEQPATVAATLGVPTPNRSIGLAAGGLPVEGTLYGESIGYLFQTLLALNTAGYTDPALYGPQINFINDNYWNQAITGALSELTPLPFVPASATYLGPIYGQANYGDVLRYWLYDDTMFWAPLAVYDHANNPNRYTSDLWLLYNANQGGPTGDTGLVSRAANIWGNSSVSESIMYFLSVDPAISPPADPRPSLPKEFIQPGIGRILSRSDWTASQSWFTFRCSWETINHISGDCGEFEYFRNGNWLTKEWSGYGDDGLAYSPLYHNTLSIKNDTQADSGADFLWEFAVKYGGQWNNGGNAGDPSVWLSVNDNRSYAQVDATNLYNFPEYWTKKDSAEDVKLARRSIAWLAPDTVVIYDRAQTGHAGRFKYQNFSLIGSPVITDTTATSISGNQQLTIQSLLPADATLTEQHFWKTDPSQEFDLTAQLEPCTDRLLIADPAMPKSTRFLTVLQGTNQGVTPHAATEVNSSSGTAFQGAYVNASVVMFPVNTGTVGKFSYQVPSTVTRHLITGLAPSTGYKVAIKTTGGVTTVTVAPGGTTIADVGGLIDIGFAASAAATQGGYFPGTAFMQPE
jgi:hypothetical protein